MSRPSAPQSLVLHVVGIKGLARPEGIAPAAGLGADQVEVILAEAAGAGLIEHRQGALEGWALTPVGRKQRSIVLAEELEASGAALAVESAYRRFLLLNPDLLATCAAWQLRPADGAPGPVVNDHTDPEYDAEVVERLAGIHRRAQPVLTDLALTLARFGGYRPRLQAALDRVVAGEGDWFTRPVLDSYHNVWFEFHQDLLDTLGIDRGDHAGDDGRGGR